MKNKKLLLTAAVLTLSALGGLNCFAQNLVPNPSFETFTTCPSASWGEIVYATPWITVGGSSDYYNQCNPSGASCSGANRSVPSNYFGTEPARTGVAYAGFTPYDPPQPNYREYIQVQLTSALIAGTTYTCSFYASCAEKKCFLDDGLSTQLAMYISVTAPTAPAAAPNVISVIPQILSATTIDATTGWTLVSGTYTAAGGEQYITIGGFFDDASTTVGNVAAGQLFAYYFVDDVSVVATVLPITLLTFTGNCTENSSVRMQWQTATEQNNDYFTIERAAPSNSPKGGGLNWEVAGIVKGAGNSSVTRSYEFTDHVPLSFGEGRGEAYYRLKQTDFDGKSEIFNDKQIAVDVTECATKVFPNPAGNTLYVPYVAEQDGEITLQVYDVIGKLVKEKAVAAVKGNNTFTLDLTTVAQGMYVLRVKTSAGEQKQKFVKGIQ